MGRGSIGEGGRDYTGGIGESAQISWNDSTLEYYTSIIF